MGTFLAVLGGFLVFGSDLLFLAGGRVVEAERSWAEQDKTFYETRGEVHVFDTDQILYRSESFRLSTADVRHRAAYYLKDVWVRWYRTPGHGPFPWKTFTLLIGLSVLLASAAAAAGKGGRSRKAAASEKPSPLPVVSKRRAAPSVAPRLVRQSDVVRFFLRIYRMQMKAPAASPGKIEPLAPEPGNPGRRFRLGIRIEDDWKWRYMTIRPIGEETGSKSQCFYVIYDTHIVVKIPPVPIRDFSDYITRIQFESEIVRALDPCKCIIPNVSVILGKVHRFEDAALRSEEQLESDYIRLLQRSSAFHACLKIENDFAFFMDLSRDYFLSHAMTGPAGERTRTVMAEEARILEDCRGFEHRFGEENAWICLEIQSLQRQFAAEIRGRLYGAGAEVPGDEKIKEWFYLRLTDPSSSLDGGAAAARQAAEELLDSLLRDGKRTVDAYRKVVAPHARKVAFHRTRPMKEALATNLLRLLAWLEERRVALRDLKPDNLLVSGEPSRYPTFLAAAEEFSIGLIDLETAVLCAADGTLPPKQPQLGGTPTYATPSHFSPNKILERLYPDLCEVFFLQDMYAMIGIIFRVVAGKGLFRKSGGLFPGLIDAFARSLARKESIIDVYRRYNAHFWKTAGEEFSEKAARHRRILGGISVNAPESILDALCLSMDRQLMQIEAQINAAVDRQTLVASEKSRRELCSCSYRAVLGARDKSKRLGGDRAVELGRFFEALAEMKKRQENLGRLHRRLSSAKDRIAVHDLLAAMFERVSYGLYLPAEPLSKEDAGAPLDAPVDADRAATLSYTHTAAYR